MIFKVNTEVEISILLGSIGVEVYVGEESSPTVVYDLVELVTNFIDDHCDTVGKIYAHHEKDLDDLLAQMKVCVNMLEDAKN
jgi:hypothetical protein